MAAAEFELGAITRSMREAFAARAIDWRDVEGVLIRQQGRLDFAQIEANLRPLCDLKEDPEIYAHYEALRDRYR